MLCLFLPCFFSTDISFPIYNCKLVEDSHEVNRACRSKSGARLRFTSAKVLHLGMSLPLFAAFCRFSSRLQVQNQDEKVVYLTEN